MMWVSRIYDWFAAHRRAMIVCLAAVTAMLLGLMCRIGFSEQITDFLPLGKEEKKCMDVYQQISGAERLFVLLDNPNDPDRTVEAIECFKDRIYETDVEGICPEITSATDLGMIRDLSAFVYENMPYFLEEKDYERIDSLLSEDGYFEKVLERNRQALMFPTGSVSDSFIESDPLGLFSPVMKDLQSAAPEISFESYDGYIFTPDMGKAIVMTRSQFGSSETSRNAALLSILHESLDYMQEQYEDVTATIVGGPEIAVGNASRIKKDSFIAIILSMILIIALMSYSIASWRNVLLIMVSISWGWIFAMGWLAVFKDSISIIAIGISSVVLGIAVNYPLHLIVHCAHQKNIREALGEIASPLLVGNITTVGAFMALIPLQAVALRDLGLYACLLLVGTILFVLIFLPHFVKTDVAGRDRFGVLEGLSSVQLHKSKALVSAIALLTVVLAVFSFDASFDPNISNINYMTPQQRENMRYFQNMMGEAHDDTRELYVISSAEDFDTALEMNRSVSKRIDSLRACGEIIAAKGVGRFIVSAEEQHRRLVMWNDFVEKNGERILDGIERSAPTLGFSRKAFGPFKKLISPQERETKNVDYFSPLTENILSRNITKIGDECYVVNILEVHQDKLEHVKGQFDKAFDIAGMNSAISRNLSDNFNYIGWACSLIVFLFLWFSFGRVELAMISFLPMAVSWIWILGIMGMSGIQFNIVNVILATFIFGQGDDYTIFITEGCQYEYTYRKKILDTYKNSILQSALIMFAGIGTLIFAKHPAMRSLADITLIGMSSVVMMAFVIPPLMFKWLTTSKGKLRKHPITLKTLLCGMPKDPIELVYGRYIYKGMEISRSVKASLRSYSPPQNIGKEYEMDDDSYGEIPILMALTHPDTIFTVHIADEQKRLAAARAAEDFIENIRFTE